MNSSLRIIKRKRAKQGFVLQVANPYQTNTTERGKLSTGKYTNSQLGKRYRLAPELFQVKAAKGPPNIVLVLLMISDSLLQNPLVEQLLRLHLGA